MIVPGLAAWSVFFLRTTIRRAHCPSRCLSNYKTSNLLGHIEPHYYEPSALTGVLHDSLPNGYA
jgi:hypothetical protein